MLEVITVLTLIAKFIAMVGLAIFVAIFVTLLCVFLISGLALAHELTVSFVKKYKVKIYRFLLKFPMQFSYIIADIKRPWKIYNREQRRRE